MKSCGIFKLRQWRKLFIRLETMEKVVYQIKIYPFCQVSRFLDFRNARFCIFKLESFGNNGKSLNKWKKSYWAWPTTTVHPGLNWPSAHLANFFLQLAHAHASTLGRSRLPSTAPRPQLRPRPPPASRFDAVPTCATHRPSLSAATGTR
jgi:hypothetical protein